MYNFPWNLNYYWLYKLKDQQVFSHYIHCCNHQKGFREVWLTQDIDHSKVKGKGNWRGSLHPSLFSLRKRHLVKPKNSKTSIYCLWFVFYSQNIFHVFHALNGLACSVLGSGFSVSPASFWCFILGQVALLLWLKWLVSLQLIAVSVAWND